MLTYYLYPAKLYESLEDGPNIPPIEDLARQYALLVLGLLPYWTTLISVDRPSNADETVPFTVIYWHPFFSKGGYIEVDRQIVAWMEGSNVVQRGSILSIRYYKKNGTPIFLS